MPYVNIPNDLSKIKSKMVFNLTKRQLICFGAAAILGIPLYLLSRPAIGNSAAMFVMIIIMLPFFFVAMYERDGLPAEKVARNIIRAKIVKPGVRLYKTENFYAILGKGELTVDANKKAETATDTNKKAETAADTN